MGGAAAIQARQHWAFLPPVSGWLWPPGRWLDQRSGAREAGSPPLSPPCCSTAVLAMAMPPDNHASRLLSSSLAPALTKLQKESSPLAPVAWEWLVWGNSFPLLLSPGAPTSPVGSLIPASSSVSHPGEHAIYFILETWLIYSVTCFLETPLQIHSFLTFTSQGQFIHGIRGTHTFAPKRLYTSEVCDSFLPLSLFLLTSLLNSPCAVLS